MKRNRRTQLIIMITLMLAIVGMTLGFAAFSSTLNISSSATVTPNSDNFSVEVLGADVNGDYTSSNSIVGVSTNGATGSTATILNGKAATISNINVSFSEPGQSVEYRYIIKNTGLYDTYLRTGQVKVIDGNDSPIICSPADGSDVTKELMDSACDAIDVGFYFEKGESLFDMTIRRIYKSGGTTPTEFSWVTEPFLMKPGEYITAIYSIVYDIDGGRADGAFNVEIADSELVFSTAPAE